MVFTLCKAEQPLKGMKLQERKEEKEEKFGKEKWKDDLKETKYKMCLLTLDKKVNPRVEVLRIFEVFIILEFRTIFQLPTIFLSSVSKLKLLQYLYTTSESVK